MNKPKPPTQFDVARKAGVSRSTVSIVMSNAADADVPLTPETRRRVLEAAEELGYSPDARANMLRSGRSRTIGVLFPDLENPHYWQYLKGIEESARVRGYDLLIVHSRLSPEDEEESLQALAQRKIDGLIVMLQFPEVSRETQQRLARNHRVIVDLTSYESPFDCLLANYEAATRALMDHLWKLGHRRIGFLDGGADDEQCRDRRSAHRDYLTRRGVETVGALSWRIGTTIRGAYTAAHDILRRSDRPTALVTTNDHLSMGIVRAAADLGLRVPEDLSVAGYDDNPMAEFTVPRLTTVHRDTELMGRKAVEVLLSRLEDPEMPKRVESIPWRLVVRESTGPAPEAPHRGG